MIFIADNRTIIIYFANSHKKILKRVRCTLKGLVELTLRKRMYSGEIGIII